MRQLSKEQLLEAAISVAHEQHVSLAFGEHKPVIEITAPDKDGGWRVCYPCCDITITPSPTDSEVVIRALVLEALGA